MNGVADRRLDRNVDQRRSVPVAGDRAQLRGETPERAGEAPLVRGIYACCYLVFEGEPPADVPARYREHYAGSRFVRVSDEVPNANLVSTDTFSASASS